MSKIKELQSFLLRNINKPWYPAMLFVCNFLDVFILVMPLDILLVAGILAKPRRFVVLGAAAMAGNMAAAAIVALLAVYQLDFLVAFFHSSFDPTTWSEVEGVMQSYGYVAALLFSITFIPFQLFILVGAITGMSMPLLFTMVFIGRAIKYIAVSAGAAYSPNLIRRILKMPVEGSAKEPKS